MIFFSFSTWHNVDENHDGNCWQGHLIQVPPPPTDGHMNPANFTHNNRIYVIPNAEP